MPIVGDDRRLIDEQVAYYRARAAEYDATSRPDGDAFAPHAQAIRDALRALDPRGRVLEIAAGTGQWTGLLAEHADQLLVTDAAPEMLDHARTRVGERPSIRYAVADAFAMEPSHAFDTVFFGFFLSHVPPSLFETFWRGLSGLLAPGGRVIFVDEGPHDEWQEDWIDSDAGVVRRALLDGSAYRAIKVHWRPAELEARLARLGWSAAVTPLGPFYWGWASPFS